MFSAQKQRPRDRSRSTNRSSLDLPSRRTSHIPEPAAGTKRLFSNRQNFLPQDPESDQVENDELDPSIPHSGKRNRSDNWPLPNSSPVSPRNPLHSSHNVPNSPSRNKRDSSQKRPSRFVEGSMNDRVSQKPPVPYLGDGEDLEEDHSWEQRYQGGRKRPESSIPTVNGSTTGFSDASRHSTLFEFGKKMVSHFKPWKLFKSDKRETVEDVETTQQRLLRERKERAEKLYAELKPTGHFPTTGNNSVDALSRNQHTKHDSGIALPDERSRGRSSMDSNRETSMEDKRKGRVFLFDPPFSTTSNAIPRETRAGSALSTPSKQSTFGQLKKPSLSSIKKKFSYDAFDRGSEDGSNHEPGYSARRIPSRKELEKQQKLVKRVSDLEGKLEAARRQLNDALAEPVPSPKEKFSRGGRRKFVPGAMPTLPSERLLSGYVHTDDTEDDDEEIGKAVPYEFLEQERGRSRQTKEMAETLARLERHSSPLRIDMGQGQNQPITSIEKYDDDDHEIDDSTSVSASTKVSKYSQYNPQSDVEEDNSSMSAADESTSVVSGSEPASDDEVTPKAKGRKKSVSATPKKQQTPAKATLRKSATATPTTKKRKSVADTSGTFKPAASDIGDSEHAIPSSNRITSMPKRKAVGSSTPVAKKVQKTGSTPTSTPPKRPSPPKRAAPPPPTAPIISSSAKFENVSPSRNSPVREIRPSQAVGMMSSPGTIRVDATPKVPARTISRKAVPSSGMAVISDIRAGKPKIVQASHPRARQSASPPPSSANFEPAIVSPENVSRATLKAMAISKPTVVDQADSDGTSRTVPPTSNTPQPRTRSSSRTRNPDHGVPPMPKLPKTVRLPNGDIVDVKVKAPISQSRASSASESRVASGRVTKSTRASSRISVGRGRSRDEEEVEESIEKKEGISKSDTKASFEWPPDVF